MPCRELTNCLWHLLNLLECLIQKKPFGNFKECTSYIVYVYSTLCGESLEVIIL